MCSRRPASASHAASQPSPPSALTRAALDTATERALYLHLQQHSRCYISIAHRRQLAAFHSHVLEAAGDGTWALLPAAEFLARLAREERGGG